MAETLLLIDTSLWVPYFRPGCPGPLLSSLRQSLQEERVVGLRPIWLELMAGVGSEPLYATLRDFLQAIPLLDMDDLFWDVAYQLAFTLRRNALTIPSMDTLIAAAAIRHGVTLWHADRHFDLIARHAPLKLLRRLSAS